MIRIDSKLFCCTDGCHQVFSCKILEVWALATMGVGGSFLGPELCLLLTSKNLRAGPDEVSKAWNKSYSPKSEVRISSKSGGRLDGLLRAGLPEVVSYPPPVHYGLRHSS